MQKHFLVDALRQLRGALAGLRMQSEPAQREMAAGRGDPLAATQPLRPQPWTSRRLLEIDISMPRPSPSVTIAVPP